MNNNFRIGQWKNRLRVVEDLIKRERNRLVLWYGEDSINNIEFSIALHRYYKRADDIIAAILEERGVSPRVEHTIDK